MTFHHTEDRELIRAILTNPKFWRLMVNDSAPVREEFSVEHGNYRAILCRQDDGLLAGLFLLCPTGAPASAEVHFCFLPHVWGSVVDAGKEFVEWVWRETSLLELFGCVPDYNSLALRLAKACGFVEMERKANAGTKNGEPFDLIVTRIERPK